MWESSFFINNQKDLLPHHRMIGYYISYSQSRAWFGMFFLPSISIYIELHSLVHNLILDCSHDPGKGDLGDQIIPAAPGKTDMGLFLV